MGSGCCTVQVSGNRREGKWGGSPRFDGMGSLGIVDSSLTMVMWWLQCCWGHGLSVVGSDLV
jgi:hypothetical protein